MPLNLFRRDAGRSRPGCGFHTLEKYKTGVASRVSGERAKTDISSSLGVPFGSRARARTQFRHEKITPSGETDRPNPGQFAALVDDFRPGR